MLYNTLRGETKMEDLKPLIDGGYCTAEEAEALDGFEGTLHRVTQQFHWENRGYASFDAFLDNEDALETIRVSASMIEAAVAQAPAVEPG